MQNIFSLPKASQEQLFIAKAMDFFYNKKDAGKQLQSFCMNFKYDIQNSSQTFKLLTPEQNAAFERLEDKRYRDFKLDNKAKILAVIGVCSTSLILLFKTLSEK